MYYFRADGSAVTGAGHLMRCLTVAQELQKRIEHPEELCFLCAEQASAELLQSWNMPVKILGTDPADLEGELPALEGLIRGSGHVFLVDSYAVTDAYLQALHRFGRVYLLDDMQQHAFPVDGRTGTDRRYFCCSSGRERSGGRCDQLQSVCFPGKVSGTVWRQYRTVSRSCLCAGAAAVL